MQRLSAVKIFKYFAEKQSKYMIRYITTKQGTTQTFGQPYSEPNGVIAAF
jgi:hypothetical protein